MGQEQPLAGSVYNRLGEVSSCLGDADWLGGAFSAVTF